MGGVLKRSARGSIALSGSTVFNAPPGLGGATPPSPQKTGRIRVFPPSLNNFQESPRASREEGTRRARLPRAPSFRPPRATSTMARMSRRVCGGTSFPPFVFNNGGRGAARTDRALGPPQWRRDRLLLPPRASSHAPALPLGLSAPPAVPHNRTRRRVYDARQLASRLAAGSTRVCRLWSRRRRGGDALR